MVQISVPHSFSCLFHFSYGLTTGQGDDQVSAAVKVSFMRIGTRSESRPNFVDLPVLMILLLLPSEMDGNTKRAD